MLAPGFEAAAELGAHAQLFDLCQASAALWPDWSETLAHAAGSEITVRSDASLAIALNRSQAERLNALIEALRGRGAPYETLSPDRARAIEPALAAGLAGAMLLPTDTQVDNRAIVAALIEALRRAGVQIVDHAPTDADVTLTAAGWRTPGVAPIRGQMMSLRPRADHPKRVIRLGDIYIAPKSDRTVVGATMEPGETGLDPDLECTNRLRADAALACPALADGDVLERWAGVRPATPDKAPILGWTGPGRYVASGHYRNGVLLAPLTGTIAADAILDGRVSPLAAAFAPQRFETAHL